MIKRKKKRCLNPNNTDPNKMCYYQTKKFGCPECTYKGKQKELVCVRKKSVKNGGTSGFKIIEDKKRRVAIKKVSKKQEFSNRAVTMAKLKVLQDWIQEHGRVWCSSCGTNQGRIDFSHVIPISDNKKLEDEHEIIFPQCSSCHEQTEYGLKGMKDFINYDEIMAAIKKHDRDYYRKLLVKHNS